MKTKTMLFLVLAPTVCWIDSSLAQMQPLKGGSAIELNLGLWGGAKAEQNLGIAGIRMSAATSGFTGNLTYCYWLREHAALTVSGALVAGEAKSDVTIPIQQTASSVVSVLAGVRYYVPKPDPDGDIRPYLAASLGSFIGSEASNNILSQSAHSESTFGGRLGLGIDVFLGSLVKLGAGLGYNIMSDFRTPVGARTNYNGIDGWLGIGFVFGK